MRRTVKVQSDFAPARYRLAMLFSQTGQKQVAAHELVIVERMKNKERKNDPGKNLGK